MKKLLILLALILAYPLHATVTVPVIVNGSQQSFFPTPVQAKVFDRATGRLFVGLAAGAGSSALSFANRADFGANSIFQPIALNDPFNQNNGIEFLALATYTGNPNPVICAVIQPASGPETAYGVAATNGTLTNQIATGSLPINDASGATDVNGLRTSGIVGLAASQSFMFPAVKPCGGNFGADCNGGIASVLIAPTSLSLAQVPAIPGDTGIKAQILDPTTPQVLINNSPTIVPNTVDLFWDDQLQRLYVGLQLTTAGFSSIGVTCATGTGICNTAPLVCPTGLKPDYENQICVTCPSGGFYNPAGMECQLCPTGQQFNVDLLQCITATCPAGSFFNPDPTVLACVTCPFGLYFDQNSLTCVVCPGGNYFDPNSGCIPCQNGGTFNPVQGTCVAGPISCPSGYGYSPVANTCVFIEPCLPGYYFDLTDLTCVLLIPTGTEPPQPTGILAPFLSRHTPHLPASCAGPIGAPEFEKLQQQDIQMTTRVSGSGGKSVVVAMVDSAGQITFNDIADDSVFTAAPGNQTYMVGVYDTINADSLAINKVRVMHTSTGFSYLIINGGNGVMNAVNGDIYALPLVDLGDPTNPAQGTVAATNSAIIDFKFQTPAAAGTMPTDTDPAVVVGTGSLALPTGTLISDIDVVGDTVYVSIANNPDTTTDGGILYSQALFDSNGVILRWTPWTKKAFPPFATTTQPVSSAVQFFAVDGVSSKLWAINNTFTAAAQTAWSNVASTTANPDSSLLGQLNAIIKNAQQPIAATAVLDLDQSTRGFTSNTARYALFAGNNQIIFALVSQALGGAVNSPQSITANYSLPTNLLATSLPLNACQVQVLEYARQLTGSPTNYFFAGTQNGLFVFSDSGSGFDVASMNLLNAAPFSNGSWTQAPTITGSITDIKTTGNVLYVLTQIPATATASIQNTLYSIPFASTVAAMFAAPAIIAQTGIAPFTSTVTFNAIEIISTMADGSQEQLVLGSNNGLYVSQAAGGVQAATTQTGANWQLLANTLSYYNGISAIDNASIPVASPSTVWPFYIADAMGLGTFDVSVLQQLSGSLNTGPFNFVPPLFNSITAGTSPAFATLPQITAFWSDGERRIASVANIGSSCTPEDLLSLPFNTIEWDLTEPDDAVLSDPVLNRVRDFYWIKQIGVTGILMVGTDNGLVALE